MARVRMVTRTVKSTVVNVMCLDTQERKAVTNVYEISGVYPDTEKLLKALQAVYDTETLKLVHIATSFEEEQLYGMPENEFMMYAKKLPPRGTSSEDVTDE